MNWLLLAALLLLQTPNGTIAGRLLAGSGGPAVGVRVTVKLAADFSNRSTPSSGDVLVSLAETDLEGRYRIENIPPGNYYITAGLAGSPTYFPGTSAVVGATTIAVAAGARIDVPEFKLQSISIAPAQLPTSPAADSRFRQSPRLALPISIDVDQEVRKSFEDIGKMTGVGILFDRRVPAGLTAQFKVEGVAALEALNTLSTQTGNTLLPLGPETIIVAPAGLNPPSLDLELPNRDLTTASVYPGFNPQPAYLPALDIDGPVRDAFETIAHSAGLSVVFDRDYRNSSSVRLKLDNADIYSALDTLSAQVRTFWMPDGNNSIYVADDNSTKHRDYDLRMVKTFYLSNLKAPEEINAAIVQLRAALPPGGSGGIFALPQLRAMVVVDAPRNVVLAEKLIASMDSTLAVRGEAQLMDSAGNLSIVEPGGLRNITPYHSILQPRTRTVSLNGTLPTHDAFEKLAAAAGLTIVYDSDLRLTTPPTLMLKLKDVDLFAALDSLSLQTKTFWAPLDSKTIFVADDNATKHRDRDPQIVKTFPLKHAFSTQALNDIVNVLRQAIHVDIAYVSEHANSIVIRTNPKVAALAEILINNFDKEASGVAASSASMPARSAIELEIDTAGNVFVHDALGKHNITPARTQMQPSAAQPVTMQTTADARATFEALARNGGLQVQFDARFTAGRTFDFHLENENVFDALNLLALQTGSFWQMSDSRTIMVAPTTPAVRRELEQRIPKTIPLVNIQKPADIAALAELVRAVLLLPASTPNLEMHAIEIGATPSNAVLAERLISALDVP